MHERRDLPDRLAQSGDPPRAHEDVAGVRGAPVLPGGVLRVSLVPLRGIGFRRPRLPRRRGIRRREPVSGPLIEGAVVPGQGVQALGQLGSRGRGEAGSPLEGGRSRTFVCVAQMQTERPTAA